MNTIRIVNVSFQIWGSFMSIVLIGCLAFTGRYKSRTEKYYLALLVLNMNIMIMDAIALYFRGGVGYTAYIGVRLSNFAEFIFASIIPVVFLDYAQAYLEEKIKHRISPIYHRVALWMMGIAIISLITNLFLPFIYNIDEKNIYSRMSCYPVVMLPSAVVLIVTLLLVRKYRDWLETKEKIPFVIYIFVPFIGILGSVLVYGIVFSHIGSTVVLVIMFVFLQVEQSRRMEQKEQEMMQQKMAIAMSQIQPHFIYNTLGTIRSLCKRNPKLAADTITKFSQYLRTNLNSVNIHVPVLFETELEHVNTYIELEKLRFGEKFDVKYEIETTNFYIPAITIQPMVENAIHHGMMNSEDICHITISTRQVGDEVEILVMDDGSGFDPNEKKTDGKSHVGLQNVKDRIEYMVHGTFLVESMPGAGTKVTICVPGNEHTGD